MNKALLRVLLIFICLPVHGQAQQTYENIITSDVENFWIAYDKVTTTTDSALQMKYLNELFFDKGTEGLTAIMDARRYRPEEYRQAINSYPKYWQSIRANTLKVNQFADQIQSALNNFRILYPALKPAKVYFEIGVFRTPGTLLNNMILIGTELAMADKTTIVDELPSSMDYVKIYTPTNRIDNLDYTCIHEYVHTQQKVEWGYDLLSQSVFEGSAEYVSEIVTGRESPEPCISFGKSNDTWVKQGFMKEMFSPWWDNWIWNDTENEFKQRDLGYYIGYAISSKHYEQANDKSKALKEIIELDYNDPKAFENFVEHTGYFSKSLAELKEEFEKNRPNVVGVDFENRVQNSPLQQIKIEFSEPMDVNFNPMDAYDWDKSKYPYIKKITFLEEGRSAIYHMDLKPDTAYEFSIGSDFRSENRLPVKAFCIKFRTKE